MTLKEMGDRISGWRIEIVATDISNDVLQKARTGIYSQFEVQRGLPIAFLIKYFGQVGNSWQIAPGLREMVQFRPLNLISDFAHLGTFDVVFCRNVLLYFDQKTKGRVLDRVAEAMEGDGYLVLGAAETVIGLTDRFQPVAHRRGLYAPRPAAVAGVAATTKVTHLRLAAAATG
jgi:chemotaxis protein methyltransferase CheR